MKSLLTQPMQPPTISIESDLPALEAGWKRLFEEAGRPSPFLSWEWHQSWTETQQRRIQPQVVVGRFPDGRLSGLLPLQKVRHRGLKQVEFLTHGSGADELDCLLHPQAPNHTTHDLIGTVLTLPWQVCRLETMSPRSHLAMGIESNHGDWPSALMTEPGEALPYLPLPPTFDDLLAHQSANFRSEIRRRRRNFERHGGATQLRSAQLPEEISTAIEILFDLHNRRRQQKQDIGIFEEESLRRFHRHVALRLAKQHLARVYVLYVADQPVAALYGFESRQRFYYFQSGWHPGWSHLSPGTVLLSMVIEDCIGRGLKQFEFLRGEEGYKSRWTDSARPTIDLLMVQGVVAKTYLHARAVWRHMIQKRAARHAGSQPMALHGNLIPSAGWRTLAFIGKNNILTPNINFGQQRTVE